ncbi:hypothetical protein SO802_015819 [Lithocarpus litseifolius]|uniref:Uncharacterized protein n=1 Tax=Lithocarpus litseifolius TaxID=425828 RepID=A0AAW2CWV5_9ROSI
MILPVVKLGTLALKTICKPIANRLKKEAGLHPKFRHFIIDFAQVNHRFTTKIQRRIYGQATNAAIRPLNEEKAVQAAADLLGELFIFTMPLPCFNIGLKLVDILTGGGGFVILPVEGMVLVLLKYVMVAGAAVIFEVQRSSRSEARKEELRKQELQAMKQRDDDLTKEVELLRHKIEELEKLAKGRGLAGIFNFRHAHTIENDKSKNT